MAIIIKNGANVIICGRHVAFQLAAVAIPRNLFADILRLIVELRPPDPIDSVWRYCHALAQTRRGCAT